MADNQLIQVLIDQNKEQAEETRRYHKESTAAYIELSSAIKDMTSEIKVQHESTKRQGSRIEKLEHFADESKPIINRSKRSQDAISSVWPKVLGALITALVLFCAGLVYTSAGA